VADTRRIAVLIAGAAVLLAGCRVDARVNVNLQDNGTGTVSSTVTFDADAVQQMGGPLGLAQAATRFEDLRRAGWVVSPITTAANGSSTITMSHSFAGEADLSTRLADLVGAEGMLRDPTITNSHGWLSSTQGLTLVVDMRAPSAGIVSDAALAAKLRAAGIDPVALDARLSKELKGALHLTVAARLPNGDTRTFTAANGTLTTANLTEHAKDWDRIVKVGLALTLALLAGSFALAASMSARRDRRRRRARLRPEPERVPLM
jgi:hypothetical protein